MIIGLSFIGRVRDVWDRAQGAVISQFEELQAQLSPTVVTVGTLNTTVTAMGTWTKPPFDANYFSGFGTMTWTVAFASVITFQYTIINNTMVLAFDLRGTTVVAVTTAALQIKLPGGYMASASVEQPLKLIDNGVNATGFAISSARSSTLLIERTDLVAFTAAAGTTSVQGQIILPVTLS